MIYLHEKTGKRDFLLPTFGWHTAEVFILMTEYLTYDIAHSARALNQPAR